MLRPRETTSPPTLEEFLEKVRERAGEAPEAPANHPDAYARLWLLVEIFAGAMLTKVTRAQAKYEWPVERSWMGPEWGERDCEADLMHHLRKGDPLDVAAYCAFMWFHGWKTTHFLSRAMSDEAARAVTTWRETILRPIGDPDDEEAYAVDLALQTVNSTTVDPESDLSILSRQLVRAREQLASYHATSSAKTPGDTTP